MPFFNLGSALTNTTVSNASLDKIKTPFDYVDDGLIPGTTYERPYAGKLKFMSDAMSTPARSSISTTVEPPVPSSTLPAVTTTVNKTSPAYSSWITRASSNKGNTLTENEVLEIIGGLESGGNYGITNNSLAKSDPGKASSIWGKYQFRDATARMALNRKITRNEFLNDPELQDKAAINYLRSGIALAKEHGITMSPDAITDDDLKLIGSYWYGGPGGMKHAIKKNKSYLNSSFPGGPTPTGYQNNLINAATEFKKESPTPKGVYGKWMNTIKAKYRGVGIQKEGSLFGAQRPSLAHNPFVDTNDILPEYNEYFNMKAQESPTNLGAAIGVPAGLMFIASQLINKVKTPSRLPTNLGAAAIAGLAGGWLRKNDKLNIDSAQNALRLQNTNPEDYIKFINADRGHAINRDILEELKHELNKLDLSELSSIGNDNNV